MTTVDFLDKLLATLDEVIFPALAAYGIYMLKAWLQRTDGNKR
jgi:hypothetical protein